MGGEAALDRRGGPDAFRGRPSPGSRAPVWTN